MSEALKELKGVLAYFGAHTEKAIESCNIIEEELKEKDYLDSFVDGVFSTFELSVSGSKNEDGGYSVNFDFGDGHSMTLYCKTKEEFKYWEGLFGE